MRVSKRLIDAMNAQIGHEMAASMKYLAIAGYFDGETLPSLGRFFFRQSEEERVHAMKFLHFVLDVGGRLSLPAIPAPPESFSSPEDAVERALRSEETVTGQILDLLKIAQEEGDLLARNLLLWFVDEQREEEKTMGDLLAIIRRAGPERLLDVEAYVERESAAKAKAGGGEDAD